MKGIIKFVVIVVAVLILLLILSDIAATTKKAWIEESTSILAALKPKRVYRLDLKNLILDPRPIIDQQYTPKPNWDIITVEGCLQTFKPTHSKLSGVSLFIGSPKTTIFGRVLAKIKIKESSGRTLTMSTRFVTSSCCQWYDFYFDEIDVVPGETYEIWSANKIEVALDIDSEYPDGHYCNEYAKVIGAKDIGFKTYSYSIGTINTEFNKYFYPDVNTFESKFCKDLKACIVQSIQNENQPCQVTKFGTEEEYVPFVKNIHSNFVEDYVLSCQNEDLMENIGSGKQRKVCKFKNYIMSSIPVSDESASNPFSSDAYEPFIHGCNLETNFISPYENTIFLYSPPKYSDSFSFGRDGGRIKIALANASVKNDVERTCNYNLFVCGQEAIAYDESDFNLKLFYLFQKPPEGDIFSSNGIIKVDSVKIGTYDEEPTIPPCNLGWKTILFPLGSLLCCRSGCKPHLKFGIIPICKCDVYSKTPTTIEYPHYHEFNFEEGERKPGINTILAALDTGIWEWNKIHFTDKNSIEKFPWLKDSETIQFNYKPWNAEINNALKYSVNCMDDSLLTTVPEQPTLYYYGDFNSYEKLKFNFIFFVEDYTQTGEVKGKQIMITPLITVCADPGKDLVFAAYAPDADGISNDFYKYKTYGVDRLSIQRGLSAPGYLDAGADITTVPYDRDGDGKFDHIFIAYAADADDISKDEYFYNIYDINRQEMSEAKTVSGYDCWLGAGSAISADAYDSDENGIVDTIFVVYSCDSDIGDNSNYKYVKYDIQSGTLTNPVIFIGGQDVVIFEYYQTPSVSVVAFDSNGNGYKDSIFGAFCRDADTGDSGNWYGYRVYGPSGLSGQDKFHDSKCWLDAGSAISSAVYDENNDKIDDHIFIGYACDSDGKGYGGNADNYEYVIYDISSNTLSTEQILDEAWPFVRGSQAITVTAFDSDGNQGLDKLFIGYTRDADGSDVDDYDYKIFDPSTNTFSDRTDLTRPSECYLDAGADISSAAYDSDDDGKMDKIFVGYSCNSDGKGDGGCDENDDSYGYSIYDITTKSITTRNAVLDYACEFEVPAQAVSIARMR